MDISCFSNVRYNNDTHSYCIGEKSLIPVTSVIARLKSRFDRDGISKRIAEESGRTQEAVLKEWERKGQDSRDKGTRLHAYIEDVIADKCDDILKINERLPEMKAFDEAWKLMRSRLNVTVIHKELVIGDIELGVGGRVDAIVSINDDVPSICVFDWKTGKFRVKNEYEMLLKPFNTVDNCERNLYSLQVSLYRLIIEKNTKIKLGDGYLVHLNNEGKYTIYRAKDFREPLLKWLQGGDWWYDQSKDKRINTLIECINTIDASYLRDISGLTLRRFLDIIVDKTMLTREIINSDDIDVN